MPHYHGHRARLKARLLEAPEKLADYEILELLLGYCLVRKDTKPLAKALLRQLESMRGVFDARSAELRTLEGVGPGVEAFVVLLREAFTRYVESPVRTREMLCSPEKVAEMARLRLGSLAHEELWIAYVDGKNRLLSWERAIKGTTNSASVYPRDILERALVLKASGFILVHNHPGGDPEPSGADLNITEQLTRAVQPLLLRFIDHVIVTDAASYSLMSDGFL